VPALGYLLTALAAYFIGSVPTGFLIARARGVDIRAHGSGNIGATNVLRVLGKTAGILVLALDALKGALAVLLVPRLCGRWVSAEEAALYLPLVAGISTILGHNYTCWLGFKGGKGVATSGGVLAALVPVAFLITLATWLLVIWLSRYVSLGSVVAAAVLPFATYFTHSNRALLALTTVIGLLVIWRHRANIRRLRAGTESKIGAPRNTDPPAPAVKP
jgi:glycerol-3-phosphate acyltransferase PlsY